MRFANIIVGKLSYKSGRIILVFIPQRSKNVIKMAFEHSDFLFFTFVNSKSSTLISGAKWFNFNAKL